MRRRLLLPLVVVLAWVPATGAAAGEDGNLLAPTFRAPPAGSLIVILPPPKSSDAELAPGVALLPELLHRELVAAGYRTALLEEANHNQLWRQEVEAVGGIYDASTGALRSARFAEALARLAWRVCDETQCSLVVRPRLLTRTAKLSGSKAEWVGQSRFQPVSGTFGGSARFDGSTVALSVELTGISPQDGIVFRTLGGSSLPYRNNLATGRVEVRGDLFASADETADGVRLALRPVLAK